jgi:ATP-dependent Clp protease ATP-binding subunit ClpB
MVGAGKAEGAMDAGNMLKPALARGSCIASAPRRSTSIASTSKRTQRWSDASRRSRRRAQRRRHDRHPARPEGALRAASRGRHHRPAIVAAARLSHRYISGRQLPDKAIDLIDEAASRIRMEMDSKPEEMDKLERRLIQHKMELEALKKEKDDASRKRTDALKRP